ncbi:hypothetical protein LIER_30336 [Lithospermum erythrorhizon]|uniref:Uncharacterized protein n=1 Tax=Lithospermum erythrorhizon TaxID=34254 RepID=A0AAV3RQV8_LITER
MPGTIQVSVVEFKSSSSSPTSLKVSIGRRGYETWDNGDFSFPLTTLRDNLIVALQDADGNEIAHTGVEIMLIVEKGSWDDYFPLDGGGEVHMKLQFFLSEEDRDRVRMMRESALRKKQQKESSVSVESSSTDSEQKITGMLNDILTIVPYRDTETSVPPKVVSAEDEAVGTSSLLGTGSEYYSQYNTMKEEEKSSATPNKQEDSHGTQVQKESVEVQGTTQRLAKVGLRPSPDQEVSYPQKLDDDPLHKYEVQKPIKKSPSAVWKMISAFETNLSQDTKLPVKSPNLKSQSDQIGKRTYWKDTDSKDVTKPAEMDSDFRPNETPSFASRKTVNISSGSQAGEILTAQNEKFTDSGREDVGSKGISNEPHEEDIDIKRIVGESSEVSNSRELVKLPLHLTRNSERTFSGKEVMSLFEKHEPEDSRAVESENPEPESKGEGVMSQGDPSKRKDRRGYGKQKNSRQDGSPGAPGGIVGQAIKIAIIVGFGVLVVLTRQREPRKSKKEAKDHFNGLSGFIDEAAFSVGPMD